MREGLENIVRQARADFESGNLEDRMLADLYKAYSPEVGDARRFVEQSRRLFPHGNCGLASVYLQSRLGGDVRWGSYNNYPHTVLCVAARQIIDITADQFGGPPIYIGEPVKPWVLATRP